MTTAINKEVEVNAFYFNQGSSFKSFPKAITLDHKRYTFQDGLQMVVIRSSVAAGSDSRKQPADNSSDTGTYQRVRPGAASEPSADSPHKPSNPLRQKTESLLQKGQDVVRYFDMTDGFNNFRLRQEQEQWFLVSLRPITR